MFASLRLKLGLGIVDPIVSAGFRTPALQRPDAQEHQVDQGQGEPGDTNPSH